MKNIKVLVPVILGLIACSMLLGCNPIGGSGGVSSITFPKLYLAGKQDNNVIVVDTGTFTVKNVITFEGMNYIPGVAVSLQGYYLYAVHAGADHIVCHNLNTGVNTILTMDAAATDNFGLYLDASSDNRVFATSYDKAGVFSFTSNPFSLEAFVTEETLAGHNGCSGVLADVNYVYVSTSDSKKILKYYIASKTIEAIDIPDAGQAYNLKFNTNYDKIYVPAWSENKVYILDVDLFEFDPEYIPTLGDQPHCIEFTSDGKKAFVTNYNSDTIAVVSVESNTVTKLITLEGGFRPEYIVIDRGRNRAFVNSAIFPKVLILDTVTETVSGTIELTGITDGTDQMVLR